MQCCGSMCFSLWCVYWVPCTAPSTHTTCCHNTFLQKCNFSQAQSKLPEDGRNGPNRVGTNIRYFSVNFNILYV